MREVGMQTVRVGDISSPKITKHDIESPERGFGEMLKTSLDAVDKRLQEAEASAAGLVSGQHANIHETMIALEKANISFRMLTKVQGKAISAYQEIMRMQL